MGGVVALFMKYGGQWFSREPLDSARPKREVAIQADTSPFGFTTGMSYGATGFGHEVRLEEEGALEIFAHKARRSRYSSRKPPKRS